MTGKDLLRPASDVAHSSAVPPRHPTTELPANELEVIIMACYATRACYNTINLSDILGGRNHAKSPGVTRE